MNDIRSLENHMDRRFDKLEVKLDSYATTTTKHEADIGYIKGGLALALTSGLATAGFLLAAYFHKLGL